MYYYLIGEEVVLLLPCFLCSHYRPTFSAKWAPYLMVKFVISCCYGDFIRFHGAIVSWRALHSHLWCDSNRILLFSCIFLYFCSTSSSSLAQIGSHANFLCLGKTAVRPGQISKDSYALAPPVLSQGSLDFCEYVRAGGESKGKDSKLVELVMTADHPWTTRECCMLRKYFQVMVPTGEVQLEKPILLLKEISCCSNIFIF